MSQITALKPISSNDCNICLNTTLGIVITYGDFVCAPKAKNMFVEP